MRVIIVGFLLLGFVCWGQLELDTKKVKRMPYNETIHMAKYEVTNKQYREFLADLKNKGTYKESYAVRSSGWKKFGPGVPDSTYFTHPAFDNYPVVNITHEAATAYCAWLTDQYNTGMVFKILTVRLPTAREWELAAFGSQDTSWHEAESLPQTRHYAWTTPFIKKGIQFFNANINHHGSKTDASVPRLDGYSYTAPVELFQPNILGLYQMVGNAAEMIDQPGIAKGGSWNDFIETCYLNKSTTYSDPDPRVGFRVLVQWLSNDNGWLFTTRERCQQYFEEYGKYFEIKTGETVADIGAGNGWIEGIYMLMPDLKCSFYLEDIDPAVLNAAEFNTMFNHYKSLNGGETDDQFFFQLGDEKSTHLPKNTFDRVILNLTYHEVTYREEMLADIKSILKPEGILVIGENMASRPGEKRKDCKHLKPQENELIKVIRDAGFTLDKKVINPHQKGMTLYHFRMAT